VPKSMSPRPCLREMTATIGTSYHALQKPPRQRLARAPWVTDKQAIAGTGLGSRCADVILERKQDGCGKG
jgi:hypothetical protein